MPAPRQACARPPLNALPLLVSCPQARITEEPCRKGYKRFGIQEPSYNKVQLKPFQQ